MRSTLKRTTGKITSSLNSNSKGKSGKSAQSEKIDPLYVIFEQHLFNFPDADTDRKTFIGMIISDYLTYLRKKNIIVPRSLEQPIVEELAIQVNTMLVKKMYGCFNIEEYQASLTGVVKKRARSRYSKLSTG